MDFEDGVVRKLEELRSLYANSVQPSVACARKRLRRNPWLEITSAGCRKRYLEEAVDAEVARIVREKQSVSGAFEDTDVVRDGASEDVDDGERVDM
jgi:hypothetical protein